MLFLTLLFIMETRINKTLFVSFYTTNQQLYIDCAKRLKESLTTLGLHNYIQPTETKGSWKLNNFYKPQFILDTMNQFSNYEHIVWVDADSEFIKFPYHLFEINQNIGIQFRRKNLTHVFACLIYFKNNNLNKKFIQDWLDLIQKNYDSYPHDQPALQDTVDIYKNTHNDLFYNIPNTYGKKEKTDSDTIVRQYQASRKADKSI